MTDAVEQCPRCKHPIKVEFDTTYIDDGEVYSEAVQCEKCTAFVVVQLEAKFVTRIGLAEFEE